jgi:predicted ATPase with chaperone activity
VHRGLRGARTIADLDEKAASDEMVTPAHLAEALQLRRAL